MKWINNTKLNQYFLRKLFVKYCIYSGPNYWESNALGVWWSIWKLTTLPMWMTGSRVLKAGDLDEDEDE